MEEIQQTFISKVAVSINIESTVVLLTASTEKRGTIHIPQKKYDA